MRGVRSAVTDTFLQLVILRSQLIRRVVGQAN